MKTVAVWYSKKREMTYCVFGGFLFYYTLALLEHIV